MPVISVFHSSSSKIIIFCLLQAVCGCVGAGSVAEAVSLCLVAERLSSPASPLDVTPAVLAQLQAWWQRRMPPASPPMSDDTYLAVVER